MQDKMTRKSQYRFTKGNVIAIYAKTGSVDEGKAVEVIYLDFSEVFDAVSHNIFSDKLIRYGLDRWTTR